MKHILLIFSSPLSIHPSIHPCGYISYVHFEFYPIERFETIISITKKGGAGVAREKTAFARRREILAESSSSQNTRIFFPRQIRHAGFRCDDLAVQHTPPHFPFIHLRNLDETSPLFRTRSRFNSQFSFDLNVKIHCSIFSPISPFINYSNYFSIVRACLWLISVN